MKPIFLVIIFNIFCETLYSQEGEFDSTFGIYGKVLTNNGLPI